MKLNYLKYFFLTFFLSLGLMFGRNTHASEGFKDDSKPATDTNHISVDETDFEVSNEILKILFTEIFNDEYCSPSHTFTADYLISLETIGAEQNVSLSQTQQGPNNGYQDLTDQVIEAFADTSFDVEFEYSFGTFGAKAWVDWNNDFSFDEDEVIFTDENSSSTATSNFEIPDDIAPGDYTVRFRTYWPNSTDPDSCESINYGDAVDYTLTVLGEYCSPSHTFTADYLISLETIGAEQNVSLSQTQQGPHQVTIQ